MGSTFGGLNILVRGLAAQQTSLDTVGHNISNANTSGYSRQTVNLTTSNPQTIYGQNGAMQAGTGVSISSITRARDTFADKQMWKESSTLGYGQATQTALSKIEGVFQEPSDTGVQTVLDQFWSAWQTLATNASDDGARTAVRERGVEVVNAIQHADQQLKDMASDINSEIDINVKTINQITSEISSLNKQISNIEAGGDHANDLRDRRDLLVDQLSSMVNVNVSEDKYGNYNIQSSGVTLVDGNGYTKLDTTNPPPDATYGYSQKQVIIANTNDVVNFSDGSIKGLIDARDSSTSGVKGYMDNLEKVSQFLLQDFNAVHRAGYGTDNSTNNNFFGDNTTNYSTAPAPASWISALTSSADKLNPDLFKSGGLAKIAAKTDANSIAVTKSSADSASLATVTATGIYTGGTSVTKVQVKVDASNNITYSTDGTTWKSPDSTSPYTFTVSGLTVNVSLPSDAVNGTTYTFSLSQGNNASGDNAVNLSNSLKTDISPIFNSSLESFYSSFIGALGVQSQDAQRLTANQQTLVDQLTNLRESTAGVNMDEEMTNMIRFQKGYNAAARVLTTMDEMLDKLINSTGTAGR